MQSADQTHPILLKLTSLLASIRKSVQTKYLTLLKPIASRFDQTHLVLAHQFLRRYSSHLPTNLQNQEEEKTSSMTAEFLNFQGKVVNLERELQELKTNWNGDQSASLISQKIQEANLLITQWADEHTSLISQADMVLDQIQHEISSQDDSHNNSQRKIDIELEKIKDTPVKKQMASEFASLHQKAHLVRLTYSHEAQFAEMKRGLIQAIQSLTFEEFATHLPEQEIRIIEKAKLIEQECEERILNLAQNQSEVNPSEHRPIYSKIEELDQHISDLTEKVKSQGTSAIAAITDSTALKSKIRGIAPSLVEQVQISPLEEKVKQDCVPQQEEKKEEVEQIAQEEYIFYPIRGKNKLSSISLMTKFRREFTYDFDFPMNGMSCTHIPDSLICAGGEADANTYIDTVRRLPKDGRVIYLPILPKAKGWFPMAYRSSTPSLITVGGNNGELLSQTNSLSLSRLMWGALPDMRQAMSDRAACIISPDSLCVFGGNPFNSGRGVEILDLSKLPLQWAVLDLGNTIFEKRYNDHAAAIGPESNIIIVFGSKNGKMLWQIKANLENQESPLEMQHAGKLTLPNFSGRSTFKVFKNELYVFSDPDTLLKYESEEKKWVDF